MADAAAHSDNSDARVPAGATGCLTIDLDAIVTNWRTLDKTAVPAECAAVVKADAYGCGLAPVTRALSAAGCKTFFVATLDEAEAVRTITQHAAVYVLDGYFAGAGPRYVASNAQPVIGNLGELAEWDAFRQISGWSGGAAIHIDTGMNRLGLSAQDAEAVIPRLAQPDHGITLALSHLACAEQPQNAMNAKQVALFREVASRLSGVTTSLANSSAVFLGSTYGFDMVRPGAALYGINPTPETANPMQDVVTLHARILQTRDVARGDTVGYGATWTARRPTQLAIVAAGYADGVSRAGGSNDGTRGAEIAIAGHRCPIAGRISMDLLAVDVTDCPAGSVRRGQMATLIGDGITIDHLAHYFGTIGYEVLTHLGRRFHRVYKSEKTQDTSAAG